MRGGKRSVWIKLNVNISQFVVHQIPAHSTNSEGCGTMGTGRASHDRSDDIVENTRACTHFHLFEDSFHLSKLAFYLRYS